MKKKWIAMLLVMALCISNVSYSSAADESNTVVEIPDKVLKAELLMVGDYNNDGELTKSEMLSVLELTINGEDGYTIDTTGLEYAKNLTSLTITNSNLIDINFLSELKMLEFINLSNNSIKNTTALAELEYLDYVTLDNNQIERIPTLKVENKHVVLSLNDNLISDIIPFEGESEAGSISMYLDGNKITDITPIAEWNTLGHISLEKNPVSVISPYITDKDISISLSSNDVVCTESLFNTMVQDSTEIAMTIGNKKSVFPDSVRRFMGVCVDGETIDVDDITYEIENTEIAQLDGETIIAKTVGETKYYVKYGAVEKCYKLIVQDKEKQVTDTGIANTSMEILSGNVSSFLDEEQTLWGLNSKKSEEIKSNVISYIGKVVYGKNSTYWGNYYVLDNNKSLWECKKDSFEERYQSLELYKNVKDYTNRYALLENGEIYDLKFGATIAENVKKMFKDAYWKTGAKFALTNDHTIINILNGKIVMSEVENIDNIEIYRTTAFILYKGVMEIFYLSDDGFESEGSISDVAKILDSSFYVKTDGTVWEWNEEIDWNSSTGEYEHTMLEYKITETEPYYLDSYTMLDHNNVLWKRGWGETSFTKIIENVKSFSNAGLILLLDGTLQTYVDSKIGYQTIAKNVKSLKGDCFVTEDDILYYVDYDEMQYVIGDVVDFERCGGSVMTAVVLRKDGSVWIRNQSNDIGVPYKVKDGEGIVGDVSEDENVSMKDVQMVFSYISGKLEFTSEQLKSADINGDGKVTTNDMQRIFYYVNGKIAEL